MRLVLAGAIAPCVPILTMATMYWRISGSANWFPVMFVVGYLCFFLFGLPTIGILLKKRTLPSCLLGGGVAAIAPMLLLDLFSLPVPANVFNVQNLIGHSILFATGCVGGALFWLIGFYRSNPTTPDHA